MGRETSPFLYMNNKHVLIDARNILYRAIYASKSDNRYQIKYHSLVLLLRQMSNIMNRISPTHVHIFWDAPRDTVWRRQILPTYKDRATSMYVEDISEDLKMLTNVARDIFDHLNLRQYSKDHMEADDLIYAATVVLHPEKSVIVSSDSDMTQIPYSYNSSSVFDPQSMSYVDVPEISPVEMKSIVGDKSDHIPGYYGIGPVKGKTLIESKKHLQEFLHLKGRDTYHRNLLLTDLSLCPRLLANRLYVQKVMSKSVHFDKDMINAKIKEHKIVGLDTEYANLIPPFTKLI